MMGGSLDSAFEGLLEELFGTGNPGIIGGSDAEAEVFLAWMLMFVLVFAVVALVVAIAMYVIQAIAVMRMAKQLNVENAWLAWIPIAQGYMMGQIAERCDARRGIAVKPWGMILLYTHIGYAAVAAIYSVASGVLSNLPLIGSLVLAVLWFVNMAASVAYCVMNYISIWKMFREFYPETVNVVVFVVSIVLSVHPIAMLVASFFQMRPSAYQVLEQEETYTY